jgi:hypothetical protein
MKRCQNKLDILRHSLSGQPGLRLALSVLMASFWLGVGLLPAAAQQGEPVNLLSIVPAPADSGQIAVNSPLDIDQAIDEALAVDDAEQPKTNPIVIAEPADKAIDRPTELLPAGPRTTESPATKPVYADLPPEASASQTAPNDGLGTNDVYSSAKIGRRIFQMLGLLRLVLAIRAIASLTA